MTYTYAVLDVSPAAYEEIAARLRAAGYDHAFHNDGDGDVIDMRGIALRAEPRCTCFEWGYGKARCPVPGHKER